MNTAVLDIAAQPAQDSAVLAPPRSRVEGEAEAATAVVVPVVEERLAVDKRIVESGGALRLRKLVHEEVVEVDESTTTEVAEVERVAIDRPVDAPPSVRHEGDVTIVPVLAERLVTTKQLVLVEELRIRRRREVRHAPREVTLRREEVIVERRDSETGEWRRVDAGGGEAAAAS